MINRFHFGQLCRSPTANRQPPTANRAASSFADETIKGDFQRREEFDFYPGFRINVTCQCDNAVMRWVDQLAKPEWNWSSRRQLLGAIVGAAIAV